MDLAIVGVDRCEVVVEKVVRKAVEMVQVAVGHIVVVD